MIFSFEMWLGKHTPYYQSGPYMKALKHLIRTTAADPLQLSLAMAQEYAHGFMV